MNPILDFKKQFDLWSFPVIYQDIEVFGNVMIKGQRSVSFRYLLIKPYLSSGIWFDVGSNFGGFSARVASDFIGSKVFSFEKDPKIRDVQKWIIKINGYADIFIIENGLDLENLDFYLENLDLTGVFLFSVLHYFKDKDTIIKFLDKLALVSKRKLFIEMPNYDEELHDDEAINLFRSMGSDYFTFFKRFGEVKVIGTSESPLEPNLMRTIYLVTT